MSLNLALNSAVSGLLTAQRGLDIISHNVSNVNTVGFTRKVLAQESRVLAGYGAGVQVGEITRNIEEGLLRDLRSEGGSEAEYQVVNDFYQRMQDMFGKVGDESSISHVINQLAQDFEVMAQQVSKPTIQQQAVQSALDVTTLLAKMTEQIQSLRLQADRGIEDAVSRVNDLLSQVESLNDKIVFNSATGLDSVDLEDKRDTAITELSKYLDVHYFLRADNSMMLFTGAGKTLLDSNARDLIHSAATDVRPEMTLAGDSFDGVSLDNVDVSTTLMRGKLKALIDLRDGILPDLQGELDELSRQMMEQVNLIHNRGTNQPAMTASMTGTRIFLPSGSQQITFDEGDTAVGLFNSSGDQTASTTVSKIMIAAGYTPYGPWTVANIATEMEDWLQANGASAATVALDSEGKLAVDLNSTTLSLALRDQRADVQQSKVYSGSGSALGLTGTLTFYNSGGSLGSVAVSSTDTLSDIAANINAAAFANVRATIQQDELGYRLNIEELSGGSLTITDTSALGIAGAAQDATIDFNSDASGVIDETVAGFSNFFGLNDFYVTQHEDGILDSKILAAGFSAPAGGGTLEIRDIYGRIGSAVSISSGASLSQIASAINSAMPSGTQYGSQVLSATYTVPAGGGGNLTFVHPSGGSFGAVAIAAGDSLATIAAALNGLTAGSATLSASVVADAGGSRLLVTSSDGSNLVFTNSSALTVAQRGTVTAQVVPEGSGYRLRIVHDIGREISASQTSPVSSTSVIDALSLKSGAVRTASDITVRDDIVSQPEKVARGSMQYDTDTGRYYLSDGDNTTALQISKVLAQKTSIRSSGSLPSGSYSFQEFAAAIVSQNAIEADHAASQYETQKSLKEALDFKNSGISGVNLDEELSDLIVFQQAYAAAAKVISTTSQLFDVLNGIIR